VIVAKLPKMRERVQRLMFLALLGITPFLWAPAALADDAVPGHIVLAKPDGQALVIWDASSVVAAIVKNKINDTQANDLLERDAAKVLQKTTPELDKSAKTITVRIIYAKSGAVSPIYGTPTFTGFERYATLTATLADVKSKKTQFDAKTALPPGFAYKVIGLLPPR